MSAGEAQNLGRPRLTAASEKAGSLPISTAQAHAVRIGDPDIS